jgi:hypothetical protein
MVGANGEERISGDDSRLAVRESAALSSGAGIVSGERGEYCSCDDKEAKKVLEWDVCTHQSPCWVANAYLSVIRANSLNIEAKCFLHKNKAPGDRCIAVLGLLVRISDMCAND